MHCWSGGDTFGQTKLPAGLGPVAKLSINWNHACAISANTSLVACWGTDNYGSTAVPADVGPAVDVCVSDLASCALRPNGTLRW